MFYINIKSKFCYEAISEGALFFVLCKEPDGKGQETEGREQQMAGEVQCNGNERKNKTNVPPDRIRGSKQNGQRQIPKGGASETAAEWNETKWTELNQNQNFGWFLCSCFCSVFVPQLLTLDSAPRLSAKCHAHCGASSMAKWIFGALFFRSTLDYGIWVVLSTTVWSGLVNFEKYSHKEGTLLARKSEKDWTLEHPQKL